METRKFDIEDDNFIKLVTPKLSEYSYEQKLLSDPATMSYNAGYDVSYEGYNYDTGCIDFPEKRWKICQEKRIKEKRFFAYIKDIKQDKYVGYVNYLYNKSNNRYECGIVIESIHRGKGYAKKGLQLLIKEAFDNGIEALYDNFEKDRSNTLNLFKSVGFKVIEETTWKKFNKDVKGVVVCLKKESNYDE